MDEYEVRDLLTSECQKAGGQKAWAIAHGISAAYVSDTLQYRREPGEKILAALKLRRIVTYEMDAG